MNQPDLAQAVDARRPSAGRPLVVCTTLDLGPTWKWFSPVFDRIDWEFVGARPRNWLERKVTRPSLAAWGAYTARLLLRNPDELASTENHPAWTHMYLQLMAAQAGFALAYLL